MHCCSCAVKYDLGQSLSILITDHWVNREKQILTKKICLEICICLDSEDIHAAEVH
jgi:hypothetical protein